MATLLDTVSQYQHDEHAQENDCHYYRATVVVVGSAIRQHLNHRLADCLGP